MDLASILKRNTFWTLGVRPVGSGVRAGRGDTRGPPDGGTRGGPRTGGHGGPPGGAEQRGGYPPHAAPEFLLAVRAIGGYTPPVGGYTPP